MRNDLKNTGFVRLALSAWFAVITSLLLPGCSEDTPTVPPPPPIPMAPTGVSAVASGDDCARVTWNQNPEPDIAGYVIYYDSLSVGQGQIQNYSHTVAVRLRSPAPMISRSYAIGHFGPKGPSYSFITLPFWLAAAAGPHCPTHRLYHKK